MRCYVKYLYFPMAILGISRSVLHIVSTYFVFRPYLLTAERTGNFMTRKFKTAEKNRVNYVYYTADGKKIVITPGENGVTEEMITLLHTYDDEEVDAERREDYHVPVRFEGYSDDEGSELESRNSYLADSSADPLEKLMEAIKEEELETKIGNLKTALSILTEKQRETIDKKFFKGMTNTAIALEEGVSETAIRNRLTKIYKNLEKKI